MREFSGTLRGFFLFVIGAVLGCMTGRAAASLSMGAGQPCEAQMKSISLAQPRVTTISRRVEEVWRTAAAVFMLTHDPALGSGGTAAQRYRGIGWVALMPTRAEAQ